MPKATTKTVKKASKPKAVATKPVEAQHGPQNDLYTVRLTMAGQSYESTGTSVLAALAGIQPASFKAYGLFTVTQGNRTAQRRMLPIEVKRLLKSALQMQIFDKRMNLMLK